MSRNRTLLLGAVGLALIVVLAWYNGIAKIEQDLKFRAENLLAEHELLWVSLEVEGRTLRLLGEAPSNKAANQALSLLKSLEGVSQVVDRFTLVADQPAITTRRTGNSLWRPGVEVR